MAAEIVTNITFYEREQQNAPGPGLSIKEIHYNNIKNLERTNGN
jgi:hypothetical protein